MRILIVEDDPTLADGLTRSLGQSGYAIDRASNGEQANTMLQNAAYDLAILDLGLPKMDGTEVLKRLRQRGGRTPVLILTARDAIEDRVQGLDLGADDYLTKPFNLVELEARVRALIRRGQLGSNAALHCGNLEFDPSGRRATNGNTPLELSSRELGVLEVLMLRQNKVVNKEQIMEALCNWDEDLGDNAIEVYIHRLRKKLESSGARIRTIRGLGYLLEEDRAS
ncbi:two-component system [Novimethylophilus kurashikiensis]|uniref:Two-component system n=1 Tax=Novimethylophilus kurashikiensis TaxID=1825523 RepID=A0A2R5FB07_9PROT|nr:response regulator transcription factor [Novimethylophilus kurashikiensis]GBG13814.1 two-component system [Novimethylophilus kurashikiensis]